MSDGATTPGELFAAAHSASFIVTLVDLLARRGTHARELDADATCKIEGDRFDQTITAAHLRVRGRGIRLDAGSFSECCEQALACCPISGALSPRVTISLDARITTSNSTGPLPPAATPPGVEKPYPLAGTTDPLAGDDLASVPDPSTRWSAPRRNTRVDARQ